MPVEMRLEDVNAPAPEARPQTETETGAAVLRDLIAARLVTHEAIGDPARLAGETATLHALCGLVAGPVYRLDPFHYAFAARDADLGGRLEGLAPAARTAALDTALAAALGPEAVWLGATDWSPAQAAAEAAAPDALPEGVLLALRARDAAVTAGVAAAAPGLQAVVDAGYAVECARLTAGGDAGAPLARRLAVIEAGVEELRETLAAQAETALLLARLSQTLTAVVQRLDAQAGVLHAHIAREDAVAGRLAEIAEIAGGPAAFQETLGLALAEFLAQLERRAAAPEAVARAPQLG